MREELRQRLATEYRYAAAKMQEVTQPTNKLFYFSVFFGEAQRVLNWEWNTKLALIYTVTQHTHTQFNTTIQVPGLGQALPIDWTNVYDKLTEVSSDLAAYFEKSENSNSEEELHRILGHFAEIAFAVSGNGSYLHEKGSFKL